MNIYESIRQLLISAFFGSFENYQIILASDLLQNKLISFITDVVPFLLLFIIMVGLFAIPIYFILKLFNRVIKETNTNVISTEKEERQSRRKK